MQIKGSTKFCHFTTLESAENILSSECFFLSKYDGMNDGLEAEKHKDDANRVFSLSFTHSEALSIPMFYMYGGIDGKGCRIQFTDTKIKSIINDCTIYYVNKKSKMLKKPVHNSEYKIYFDWIYYIASDGYCEHKVEDKINYAGIDDAYNQLRTENKHYFIKNPIWKYEKEFRIVVVFSKDIEYDKIALKFGIKDNEKGVSVVLGPETTDDELQEIRREFCEYGVTKVNKRFDYQISMNLVEKNRKTLMQKE